ncbi:hypothetical protein M0802_000992 [Mischocyttarus mexicanus]|nr:hypothetical protein M0802_000992 [Mischocyttarus mexicanus]
MISNKEDTMFNVSRNDQRYVVCFFKRSSTWLVRSISDRDRHPGLGYRISNVGGLRYHFQKDEPVELHKRLPPRPGGDGDGDGVSFFCIMKSLNYT